MWTRPGYEVVTTGCGLDRDTKFTLENPMGTYDNLS